MSMLLSLHPIKSFERQRPESVPHVTSRQRERGWVSVCEWKIEAEETSEDEEAARHRKQTLSKGQGFYLITGSACWERAWSTTRTEGQKQPGGSQDMISKIIKAKDIGRERLHNHNLDSQNASSWQGQCKFWLWLKFPYFLDVQKLKMSENCGGLVDRKSLD